MEQPTIGWRHYGIQSFVIVFRNSEDFPLEISVSANVLAYDLVRSEEVDGPTLYANRVQTLIPTQSVYPVSSTCNCFHGRDDPFREHLNMAPSIPGCWYCSNPHICRHGPSYIEASLIRKSRNDHPCREV